jgi:HAD superfamily 5'-nucleotidase-like hydrolase
MTNLDITAPSAPHPHRADAGTPLAEPPAERRIFCNRTLNMRSIKTVGYDMDYTLIQYRVEEWERRAYQHVQRKLADQGWPVANLRFDPETVVRGLIIDTERGNLLKANRFGYVKRAMHGTTPLDHDAQKRLYGRIIIELGEGRFYFLNTLFSLSEATLYAQLVELLDEGVLPRVLNYDELYKIVRNAIDETHFEGMLKAEIIADPDRFVELDPDIPLTLLDQQNAGKKLLLLTNSEWHYTQAMMTYAFDRFLPERTWRDLFDLVVVSARKPAFFSTSSPMFEVVSADGLLRPYLPGRESSRTFLGGSATEVEHLLGCSGDEILYVGDHIFADVKVSKSVLRWRTALVLRELEKEILAVEGFGDRQQQLTELMHNKERLELLHSQARLLLQRKKLKYGPQPNQSAKSLSQRQATLRREIEEIDAALSPLAEAAGSVSSQRWGLLMRAGNDKSHLARQVERYADIYMSRVSNFLYHTPFFYFRSIRGTLPHDL